MQVFGPIRKKFVDTYVFFFFQFFPLNWRRGMMLVWFWNMVFRHFIYLKEIVERYKLMKQCFCLLPRLPPSLHILVTRSTGISWLLFPGIPVILNLTTSFLQFCFESVFFCYSRYFSGHPKYCFLEIFGNIWTVFAITDFLFVSNYSQRIPKRLFWISTKRPWVAFYVI